MLALASAIVTVSDVFYCVLLYFNVPLLRENLTQITNVLLVFQRISDRASGPPHGVTALLHAGCGGACRSAWQRAIVLS